MVLLEQQPGMQFLRSGKVVTEAAPPHCLLLCKKLLGVSLHPLGGNPPKNKDKKTPPSSAKALGGARNTVRDNTESAHSSGSSSQ